MNKELYKGLFISLLFVFLFASCSKKHGADATVEETAISSIKNGDPIPGQYIVVFKPEFAEQVFGALNKQELNYIQSITLVEEASKKVLAGYNVPSSNISNLYATAVTGFSITLNEGQLSAIQSDSRVSYVEQDRFIVLAKPSKPGNGGGGSTPAQSTPWGISRVGGANANIEKVAWIIDSGIDLDHQDLNVDVARSKSFLSGGKSNASPDDQNGHGTHVAGTVAAIDNDYGVVGVAAGASVVAVRVLDRNGSGSLSGVLAGVDYVSNTAASGDVANMSLGLNGISTTLDNAVFAASTKGILFSLAAGNSSGNAGNYSPARVNGTNIFTVSAMDNNDVFAYFSNYGNPPIDYCAPGVSVYSTYKNGGYATLSGTSMAAPHVTGLLLVVGKNINNGGFVSSDPDGNADIIAVK